MTSKPPAPSTPTGGDRAHLSLAGHKVSYDALFIAGAALLGTLLLLRGRSSSQGAGTVIVPTTPASPATGGLIPISSGIDPTQWSQFLAGLKDALQPPPAQPTMPTAGPTSGPAPTSSPQVIGGYITSTPDPGWAAGKGEYYFVASDYYGGGKGEGANEVAASVNALYPNAHLGPQQVIDWNKGQAYYAPGQQVYVGSFAQGVGH